MSDNKLFVMTTKYGGPENSVVAYIQLEYTLKITPKGDQSSQIKRQLAFMWNNVLIGANFYSNFTVQVNS